VIPVIRARFLSGFSGEASSILGFFAPLVCDILNTMKTFFCAMLQRQGLLAMRKQLTKPKISEDLAIQAA
jgi:hypothetical protein